MAIHQVALLAIHEVRSNKRLVKKCMQVFVRYVQGSNSLEKGNRAYRTPQGEGPDDTYKPAIQFHSMLTVVNGLIFRLRKVKSPTIHMIQVYATLTRTHLIACDLLE